MGIIVVLAALLFPVLVGAKSASDRTSCASHQRVITQAALLYSNDYDDLFSLTNENTSEPRSSRNDHTWVQLLLPYANHFGIFRCPSDFGARDPDSATFDQDLVPGDLTSRYYSASMRSDSGFNYLALAPQVLVNGVWINVPRSYAEIENTSNMVMFVDSAWAVDKYGRPYGGGSWLASPPCRYAQVHGNIVDLFQPTRYPNAPVRNLISGWDTNGSTPYGGAYPWHDGRMNVTYVDGNARHLTPATLSEGCTLQSDGKGIVTTGGYMWSPIPYNGANN
jgi:prepilin-type processing-associated H-X9-DG protein